MVRHRLPWVLLVVACGPMLEVDPTPDARTIDPTLDAAVPTDAGRGPFEPDAGGPTFDAGSTALDLIAPTKPTALTAAAMSASRIDLTWAASSDNVAVTGYRIEHDGLSLPLVTDTHFSVSGLSPSTRFVFTVRALDAAGNVSAASDSAMATTKASGCTQTLSFGANLVTAVKSAAAGSTVCLASGNWGSVSFSGIAKTDFVTIQSASGLDATLSATVTNGTTFIRFAKLTIAGLSLDGASTKHIEIIDSAFTEKLDITTTNFNNNDIVVDGNTFIGIDAKGGPEGRVSVHWPNGPGSVPAGVTLSHNTFSGGGCSDGVQLGSYGVVVGPGNVFTGLTQGHCTEHVDAIQGYGQSHSVIRGNFFDTPRVCLGFYDGGDSERFEDNVFVGSGGVDGTQCVIDLGSISNATFRHNTASKVAARVGSINDASGGSGSYSENVMVASSWGSGPGGGCSGCTFAHNLFNSSGNAMGSNTLIGSPTFVGGSAPSTWSGWQLTRASLGAGGALDGSDVGATSFGP